MVGTVIGLITDYFCMNVLGVFGFSRTLAVFLLFEISPHIDLDKYYFVFLLVFISLSVSNVIANTFFFIILNFDFSLRLILVQPLLTGLVGVLIAGTSKAKRYLDVY
jgi:hypothetical protein